MKLFALVAVLSSMGCATFASKWDQVRPGDSRESVEMVMGPASDFDKAKSDGLDVLGWRANSFTVCGVKFDGGNRAVTKRCVVNEQAQAAAFSQRQAQVQAWGQFQQTNAPQSAPDAYRPELGYAPPPARAPTSTNCTTSGYGGTLHTDCTSQ